MEPNLVNSRTKTIKQDVIQVNKKKEEARFKMRLSALCFVFSFFIFLIYNYISKLFVAVNIFCFVFIIWRRTGDDTLKKNHAESIRSIDRPIRVESLFLCFCSRFFFIYINKNLFFFYFFYSSILERTNLPTTQLSRSKPKTIFLSKQNKTKKWTTLSAIIIFIVVVDFLSILLAFLLESSVSIFLFVS